MYRNLEAEISRKNISKSELAEQIGISASTLYQKLNGKSKVTLPEAKKIREILGINVSLDYLFSINEQNTEKEVS